MAMVCVHDHWDGLDVKPESIEDYTKQFVTDLNEEVERHYDALEASLAKPIKDGDSTYEEKDGGNFWFEGI